MEFGKGQIKYFKEKNVDYIVKKLTTHATGSWSDHGRPCLLNGTMVMTMVDHGQTVMVIPWSMMVKSDILTMVESRAK